MGEDDKLFLPQVQQTVKNGGDNVSLIVVPNAGHACNIENKRFFNKVSIEYFLA
jgi:pimeloyl-ACP methyl ester carboxylesterase